MIKQNEKYNILSKKIGQFTNDGELIKIWASMNDAARQGFNDGDICLCCKGIYKTHKGFIWKYIDN